MSFITYNALKAVARAYQLKTDRDVEMFGDLWEVYQDGNEYRRQHGSALRAAVERSYAALAALARCQSVAEPGLGFRRVSSTQRPDVVIFSDHHLTPRGHRHRGGGGVGHGFWKPQRRKRVSRVTSHTCRLYSL